MPTAKCRDELTISLRRCAIDESNDWDRRLLRPRCERPNGSAAADQRDELAPLHVIILLGVPVARHPALKNRRMKRFIMKAAAARSLEGRFGSTGAVLTAAGHVRSAATTGRLQSRSEPRVRARSGHHRTSIKVRARSVRQPKMNVLSS